MLFFYEMPQTELSQQKELPTRGVKEKQEQKLDSVTKITNIPMRTSRWLWGSKMSCLWRYSIAVNHPIEQCGLLQ